jgi:starch synthase
VAVLPWGLAIEDFLEPNGLTLDDFCGEFTGSWIFGAVDALRRAEVASVIVCVSSGINTVIRRKHGATGTPISLLPLPRASRAARRWIPPYARRVMLERPTLRRALLAPALFVVKEAAPYLATPVRALAGELRHHDCAAMLCQEYEFPRFDVCVGLGRALRTPTYAIFQGGDYQRWRIERLVRPLTMRAADGFVVAPERESARIRRRYGVQRHKLARIPNPVDTDTWRPLERAAARRELGIPKAAGVVAWHGRVQLWKKGLDILVEAWASVTAARPLAELVLLLVGTGGDAGEVRSRIAERRLTNVVWVDRYLHDAGEIARLLAAADVYAFPSRHEGFPVAPIEAMACGLPVVSAAVSGMADVLGDGERTGGVLVPPGDAARLADAVAELLADPERSRELGEVARRRALEFRPAAVGQRLREFLVNDATDAAPLAR